MVLAAGELGVIVFNNIMQHGLTPSAVWIIVVFSAIFWVAVKLRGY